MKNIEKFSVLSVICLILCSCQENNVEPNIGNSDSKIELTTDELLSVVFDSENELSEIEVKSILDTYLNENIQTRANVSYEINAFKKYSMFERVKARSIKSSKEISSMLYEMKVTVDSEDYVAIVSGDRRFPFVLAYYRNASEQYKDSSNIPAIEYSKELMLNNISYIENIKDSLQCSTIEKISHELSISTKGFDIKNVINRLSLKKDIETRAKITPDVPSDAIAGAGPFIKVSWNCGMPYNRLMAQNCSDNWLWDNRYPISSVVIITAEILSFFKPNITVSGTRIDWDYLCQKEEIHEESDYFGSYVQDPLEKRNMIAKLMQYIGTQCQVNYSCSSSSVNMNKVFQFLNSYGIYLGNMRNLDVTVLKQSIDDLEPVIMYGKTSSGGGHWWLVDGYRTQVATRATFFPGFNVYMHANMGQGKSYTGYYLVGTDGSLTFDASFAHFNRDLVMYTNIRNY